MFLFSNFSSVLTLSLSLLFIYDSNDLYSQLFSHIYFISHAYMVFNYVYHAHMFLKSRNK